MTTKSEIMKDIVNLSSQEFAEKYANVDVSVIMEAADMAIHSQVQKYAKGGVNVPVDKQEFGTQTHLAKLRVAAQNKGKIANRDNKFAVKRIHVGEDIEQIQELSKDQESERENIVHGMKKQKKELKKRYGKRWKEVLYATATKRALGEEVSCDAVYQELTELSSDTLKSYIKTASHDVATKGALTRHYGEKSERQRKDQDYEGARKSSETSDKIFTKGWKRREGIAKAVDKL